LAIAWASRSRRLWPIVPGRRRRRRADELDRDLAVELLVVGGVDDAHAAGAERAQDGEAADLRTEPGERAAQAAGVRGDEQGHAAAGEREHEAGGAEDVVDAVGELEHGDGGVGVGLAGAAEHVGVDAWQRAGAAELEGLAEGPATCVGEDLGALEVVVVQLLEAGDLQAVARTEHRDQLVQAGGELAGPRVRVAGALGGADEQRTQRGHLERDGVRVKGGDGQARGISPGSSAAASASLRVGRNFLFAGERAVARQRQGPHVHG
jgi:hypothetical protein